MRLSADWQISTNSKAPETIFEISVNLLRKLGGICNMWEVFRVQFHKKSSVFDLFLNGSASNCQLPFRLCWPGMIACTMTVVNQDNETGEVMWMSLESVPFTIFSQAIFYWYFTHDVKLFHKLSQGKKTADTEIDAMVKNKWNLRWLEEKVKTNVTLTHEKDVVGCEVEVCMGNSIDKINQPGHAFWAWCHEIIRLGSKGKIAHHHGSQEKFPRISLCPRRSLIKIQGTHWHMVCGLWRSRNEIHSLQVWPVRGVDPLNWVVRSVFTF